MTKATDTTDVCRRCRKGHVAPVVVEAIYDHEGTTVSFMDEFMRCNHCEREFFTPGQSMARSRAITTALRKNDGLPTGDEIRAARLSYELNLSDFERALGVGKNTVGRWERGTVPPASSANLGLWVAINKPAVFVEWAASRGVRIGHTRDRTVMLALTTSASPGAPSLTVEDGGQARKTRAIDPRDGEPPTSFANAGNHS
jgi:putative zinc finger/helix-turn-helix YgiT family protein